VVLYRKQADGTVKTLKVDMSDPIRDGDVLFVKESLF
jgi:biotin carboxyl carrier protein